MPPRVYIVPPAVYAPALLSVVTVIVAVQQSWWFLAALPFIWLGSVCAQPNLNLAQGCLAYLAMFCGFVVIAFFAPLGIAIGVGSMTGLYLSALEKWMRMRPLSEVKDREAPIEG